MPYYREAAISSADLEDERRLFYVAMTRARNELSIFVPKHRFSQKTSTSRFIEEIDAWLKDYKCNIKSGDIIHHKHFGDGTVREINKTSEGCRIIVDFKGTIKKLSLDVLVKNQIIRLN